MKKLKYFKLAILAVLTFGLSLQSCYQYEDGVYDVNFGPQLYGEVVPWLHMEDGLKKSFDTYDHKYFSHVIRIWDGSDVWVVDIPVTDEGTAGQGNYTYALNTGIYSSAVIPVLEDAVDLHSAGNSDPPYTLVDLNAGHAYNMAAFYTSAPVGFEVAGPTDVILNCITDMGSFQFDNQGEHSSLGTPIPEVLLIDDGAFISNHSSAGNEEATYPQLQVVTPLAVLSTATDQAASAGTSRLNGMWYDASVGVDLYYMYMVPGNSGSISRTFEAGGTPVDLANAYPSYLAFDVAGGTGGNNPTLWLRDYYASQEWGANTTLRVIFDGQGNMQVVQMDWFSSVISVGGVAAGTDLAVLAEQNTTDSYMADVTVSAGTAPYTVEFFTDASMTVYATVGGVDAIYTGVAEGLNTYGAFASGDQYYIKVTDDAAAVVTSSITLINQDITGVSTTINGLEITVDAVSYGALGDNPVEFGPWTYDWYANSTDASDETNLISSGSPFTAPSSGTYYLRVTDGAGQFNVSFHDATLADPVMNLSSNYSTGSLQLGFSISGGIPAGYTAQWSLISVTGSVSGTFNNSTSASASYTINSGGTSGLITVRLTLTRTVDSAVFTNDVSYNYTGN